MEQNNQKSILQMAQGAFEERVDYEMSRVIDNIMDINTDPTAKRKITLTITLTPDKARRIIKVNVTATSKLAPTDPVETSLFVTNNANGEMVFAEDVPQIPGQINMDGGEQDVPKLLKLVQA